MQASRDFALRIDPDNDPMRQFTRFFAHELIRPLAGLRGSLELGEMQGESQRERRRFRRALEQVDRITSLLRVIPDLWDAMASVPAAGRSDLASIAHEVKESFGPLFEDAGCRFDIGKGPLWVGIAGETLRSVLYRTVDACFAMRKPDSILCVEVLQQGGNARLLIRQSGQYSEHEFDGILDVFGCTATLEELQMRVAAALWTGAGATLQSGITATEKSLSFSLPLLESGFPS